MSALPSSFVLVGQQENGDPVIEEHFDNGVVRVFKEDPRYCPISVPHDGHVYKYSYYRRGRILCFGRLDCLGYGVLRDPLPQPVWVEYHAGRIGWPLVL